MADTLPKELQDLIDRQSIHDLMMRYCRGVDRVDGDLIASCYHPDGTCEFGPLLLEGSDNVGQSIAQAAGGYRLTFHMIGNHLAEIRGDVAAGETYYFSATTVEMDGGGKQLRVRAGRYVDRIERRDREWKIRSRVVVEDWCKFVDLPQVPEGVSFRPGRQGLTDPLYALLGSLPDQ